MKGQDIANSVFPGLGYVVAVLIVVGGFVFNIGNVAGGGLGLKCSTGNKRYYRSYYHRSYMYSHFLK